MRALERAARAIASKRGLDPDGLSSGWLQLPESKQDDDVVKVQLRRQWHDCLADARAVLQAIRTPDGAVVHAGGDKLFRDYSAFAADNEARDAFTAMIDHILEGE